MTARLPPATAARQQKSKNAGLGRSESELALKKELVYVVRDGKAQVIFSKGVHMNSSWIAIPGGQLATASEEAVAAQRRRELREKLLRGDEVVVTQEGQVTDKARQNPNQPAIVVPEGKLAALVYWYERNPELYKAEIEAMRRFYPQFKLEKLSNGQLSWVGVLKPENLRPGARWYLHVVYANNHPDNSTYGGSIRVYSIDPDLDKKAAEVGGIPHTLRDESTGELYICAANPSDKKVSWDHSTTAASTLAWAAKWIAAFELWRAGDLTDSEFRGHNI